MVAMACLLPLGGCRLLLGDLDFVVAIPDAGLEEGAASVDEIATPISAMAAKRSLPGARPWCRDVQDGPMQLRLHGSATCAKATRASSSRSGAEHTEPAPRPAARTGMQILSLRR